MSNGTLNSLLIILPKDLSEYQFVIIDSVNCAKFNSDDLLNLQKNNPKTAFIYVFQVTKAGIYKGDQEFEHNIDTIIRCEKIDDNKFIVKTTKNKYAPVTQMQL